MVIGQQFTLTCQNGYVNLAPFFQCGDRSLDFVGTLRLRGAPEPIDTIETPDQLEAWFVASRLIDRMVDVGPAEVAEARRLRETIHALATQRLAGEPFKDAAVDVVNLWAQRPAAIPQLCGDTRRTVATADEALALIARRAVEVLGSSEADLLKACANPQCRMLFLDRSRGSRRQWCIMAGCGNRSKAAAYRSRRRDHTD